MPQKLSLVLILYPRSGPRSDENSLHRLALTHPTKPERRVPFDVKQSLVTLPSHLSAHPVVRHLMFLCGNRLLAVLRDKGVLLLLLLH